MRSYSIRRGGRLLSDIIYPIGSIYISTVSTNPSEWCYGLSWLGDDTNQSIIMNGSSSGKGYNLLYTSGCILGQETHIITRIAG